MTAEVIFYEKPGCLANARQKELLRGLGHRLEVRDLLAELWTAEDLRPFFGQRPVAEWFNPAAPGVKNGAVRPFELGEDQALDLMIADPILIRRPLIEVGMGIHRERCCGFEPGPVLELLVVDLKPRQDLQSCANSGADPHCVPTGVP